MGLALVVQAIVFFWHYSDIIGFQDSALYTFSAHPITLPFSSTQSNVES
jgi:hypothetical protein